MKIGIEGQRLFRKKKHGMDMVALELVKNLQRTDTGNEYFIFIKPDEDNQVLTATENFHIVELPGGFYPYWEQHLLPVAAEKYGCDILHCTSNTAPIQCKIPLVVTLHDIIYMESSYLGILSGTGSSYQKAGNIYRRWVVPRIIKKCHRIITVSNFEKQRIAAFFHLPEENRLTAVHNGVSGHFTRVTENVVLERVKEQYQLPERFFLFLGNTDPKKNTGGTVKAYSDFVRETGREIKMVILDFDRSNIEKILADINDSSLIDNIILPGYVKNTDLPVIYSLCDVFLYTSLRESFGIPMLEAMRCGAPVITGNTSSLPEVAGDAALMVDPFNPGEITKAMISLTTDRNLRNNLVQKGYARSEMFSWKRMAEEVLTIYQQIYQSIK